VSGPFADAEHLVGEKQAAMRAAFRNRICKYHHAVLKAVQAHHQ
jgi:hypothetical protein